METSQQKEQFSNAYLQAVTSVAGYSLYKPAVDDDSVDWGIAAKGIIGRIRAPRSVGITVKIYRTGML